MKNLLNKIQAAACITFLIAAPLHSAATRRLQTDSSAEPAGASAVFTPLVTNDLDLSPTPKDTAPDERTLLIATMFNLLSGDAYIQELSLDALKDTAQKLETFMHPVAQEALSIAREEINRRNQQSIGKQPAKRWCSIQ